jgi:quercetin dioxygenase-like cupin family protein
MSLVIIKATDLVNEAMHDELGNVLENIVGMQAVRGAIEQDRNMGLDIITMQPRTQFPLHTHPGHHILYILDGPIAVHYDGVDYYLDQGDSVFVPAIDPHGVKTVGHNLNPAKFLAIGYPHKHVSSSGRMAIVEGTNRSTRIEGD